MLPNIWNIPHSSTRVVNTETKRNKSTNQDLISSGVENGLRCSDVGYVTAALRHPRCVPNWLNTLWNLSVKTFRVASDQDVRKTKSLWSHSRIKAPLVFLHSFLSYFRNYSSFSRLCLLAFLLSFSFFSLVCLSFIFFLTFCHRLVVLWFYFAPYFLYLLLSFLIFLNCLVVLFPLALCPFHSFSCLSSFYIAPCRFHLSLSTPFPLYFTAIFFSFIITYLHVPARDTLYVPYYGRSLIAKS